MSQIKQLDRGSINRICSGQVIVDLKTSVKELIENALDAGATTIEIKLKQNGAEAIEVKDNGSGIEPNDRSYVALKNYTSKLKEYSDLDGVSSYGFRGEALHSLAQLSSLLYIITKIESEPCGTKLEYNQKGELVKQTKLASKTGTTVHIEGLFKTLPVRRVDFMKNLKSHYYKLIDNLTSYSICRPDIRFYCENINSQGKKQVVINTQGKSTLSNIINQQWSVGYFKQLQPFLFIFNKKIISNTNTPLSQIQNNNENNNNLTNEKINNYWKNIGDLENEECIYGYISDGKTINNNEHQLLYLNLRPVDNPRIIKIFNQIWKSKGYNYHPSLILNIHLLSGNYDINLSPDKRDVMIKDENLLLEQLTNKLQFIWKPKSIRYDSNNSSQDSQKCCSDDILYSDNDNIINDDDDSGNGINIPIDITDDNNENNINEKNNHSDNNNSNNIMSNSMSSSNNISLSQSSLQSQNNTYSCNDNYMLVFSDITTQNGIKSQKCENEENNNNNNEENDDDDDDFVEKTNYQNNNNKDKSKKSKLNVTLIDDDNSSNNNSVNNSLSSQSQTHKTSQSSNHSNISDIMMCDLDNQITPQKAKQNRNGRSENSGSRSRSRSRSRSTSPLIKRKIKEITSEERERRTKKKYDKPMNNNKQNNNNKNNNNEKWEIPVLDVNDKDRRSEYIEDESLEKETSKKNRIDTSTYLRNLFQNNSNNNIKSEKKKENKMEEEEDNDDDDDISTASDSPVDENEINNNYYLNSNNEKLNENEIDNNEENTCRLDNEAPEYKDIVLVSQSDILFSKITIDDILNNNNSSSPTTTNASNNNYNNNNSKHFSGYKLDNETANKEFERLITKEDFERMEIIGQFNLGFIIVKLDRDIFLIDQHASDEKYNYEKLQETTQIHQQNLICAEPLDLGLSNEDIILNHLEVFEENGFRFEVHENNLVGRRLSLVSKPFSKNLEFNKQDIIELCMLLLDCPTSRPRIPKIMNMFASRACRSSVMIGQALSKKEMKKIVSHLSELEHPWNCPHGRPTMRHLFTLPN